MGGNGAQIHSILCCGSSLKYVFPANEAATSFSRSTGWEARIGPRSPLLSDV